MSTEASTAASPLEIPNVENYITYGYTPAQGCLYGKTNNIGSGAVETSPIFKVTYKDGNTFSWGVPSSRQTYAYPDQVSGSPLILDSGFNTSQSIVCDSVSSWKQKLALSLSGSFHGVLDGLSGSASASVSTMFGESVFDKTDAYYFFDFYIQELLNFAMSPTSDLVNSVTSAFKTKLEALPSALTTTGNRKDYLEFFATYGTHYLISGTLGGIYRMETSVTKSLVQTTTSEVIKSKLHAAFSYGLEGGSLGASAAYSHSTFASTYKSDVDIHTYIQGALGGSGTQTKTTWVNALYDTPYLVYATPGIPSGTGQSSPTQLLPLHQLAEAILGHGSAIAQNLKEMFPVFLKLPLFANGNIIGAPVSIPSGQINTATGNCMLTAYAEQAGNGVFTELKSTGNVLENSALASFEFYSSNPFIPSCGLGLPIPSANQYGFTYGETAPNANVLGEVYGLQNLPTSAVSPTTPQSISLPNGSYSAPSDGFIVGIADWNQDDGARGSILLAQGKNILAAASFHRYLNTEGGKISVPGNSFCSPVKGGQVYQLVERTTFGTPKYSACFFPLPEGLSFDSPNAVPNSNFGSTMPADADGFLLVLINTTTTDGNRIQINLKSGSDSQNVVTRSSASAQFYSETNTFVLFNTAMLPVPKGWYYEVEEKNSYGNPQITAMWFPLAGNAESV